LATKQEGKKNPKHPCIYAGYLLEPGVESVDFFLVKNFHMWGHHIKKPKKEKH